MNFKIDIVNISAKKGLACPMIGVFEKGVLSDSAKELDKICNQQISHLIKNGTFKAKLGQTFLLYSLSSSEPVLLVGCGANPEIPAFSFKKIMLSAAKALVNSNISSATCFLAELNVAKQSLSWKVKQITEATLESSYVFDLFKSQKEASFTFKEFTIAIDNKKDLKDCEATLHQGLAIANAVKLTKNLANTPSNVCTPTFLADQAKALSKSFPSIAVKVLDENEMKKLNMGALLGVSQGSAEEAKLICLEYKGSKKSQEPIAFVGKGITFDTGGNSLKPPDSMVGMKYDMCGAATVLGVLHAAAELKLPLHIVGIIAAAENMPGGTAYKPEDILTSMSGQTIEVISTDAEGRLVLCDALTYCERYKPQAVIDIATLTGAVVIALGSQATAVLSNDEPLAADLLKAGLESNDRAWELPLWEEYQEQLMSPFADMANVGGRAAGTITAACFLARFAKKFKWAHLDVAGTAAVMGGTRERLATGRPVPMLVQYLIDKTV